MVKLSMQQQKKDFMKYKVYTQCRVFESCTIPRVVLCKTEKHYHGIVYKLLTAKKSILFFTTSDYQPLKSKCRLFKAVKNRLNRTDFDISVICFKCCFFSASTTKALTKKNPMEYWFGMHQN